MCFKLNVKILKLILNNKQGSIMALIKELNVFCSMYNNIACTASR